MNIQNGKEKLVCPSCNRNQSCNVSMHCIKGNPEKSQSQCEHCKSWFTVLGYNDHLNEYLVEKGKVV